MLHFTQRRIEAHVCISFVALKVYKELGLLLKLSVIRMSVDKVFALAQTIVAIQILLPQNSETISKNMLMKRHQCIATLISDEFGGHVDEVWRYALQRFKIADHGQSIAGALIDTEIWYKLNFSRYLHIVAGI